MKWIQSGGGPLVCVELKLADSWLGVAGNSITEGLDRELANDYERACRVGDYLGKVPLGDGYAWILGDMPLETMIWLSPGKLPRIVRVFYGDPGVDVAEMLETAGNLDFTDPAEALEVEVRSAPIVVFDSAYPGSDTSIGRLSFDLPIGKYLVLTKQFQPDDRTSVLVHSFEPIQ